VRHRTGVAAVALAIVTATIHPVPGLSVRSSTGAAFAATAAPAAPYEIYAGTWVKPDKKAPPPPGVRIARSNMKGLAVSVEYAPPARRAEFLKSIGAQIDDPFAAAPGRPDRVIAFIVTFNNQGRDQVVFNPGNVAMVTDKGESAFPLDMTDMYMSAEQRGVDDLQAVIDRSSAVMFDSSTVIPSGTGLSRLVVFRPIEGKWKQFQVHFSYLQIGRDTHTLSFNFHKREPKA